VSFNIAGGTHHAFTEKLFVVEDQAIAAQFLLNHKLAKK
jgi:acetoin utilization deacetylase AcuC-like enzyme